MANNCGTHGYYTGRICLGCREEKKEEDRQDVLDALNRIYENQTSSQVSAAELADKINNCGEYRCPACGLTSLSYLKPRCPKCQEHISDDYWEEVQRREKEKEKRRSLEIEKKKRQQENERQKQENIAREAKKNEEEGAIICASLLFVVCFIGMSIWGIVQYINKQRPTGSTLAKIDKDYQLSRLKEQPSPTGGNHNPQIDEDALPIVDTTPPPAPPEYKFTAQEELNHKLVEVILDSKPSEPEKLEKIDSLVKEGADINGSTGFHKDTSNSGSAMTLDFRRTSVIEALIRQNDVNLLKAMFSRGLEIPNNADGKDGNGCLAYTLSWRTLYRDGDLMLDLLLENGLKVDCVGDPLIIKFLNKKIDSDKFLEGLEATTYPLDQAVSIAKILIKHGYDIYKPSWRGDSILGILGQVDPASHPHAKELREALIVIKNNQ